jgi:hypothetical protein
MQTGAHFRPNQSIVKDSRPIESLLMKGSRPQKFSKRWSLRNPEIRGVFLKVSVDDQPRRGFIVDHYAFNMPPTAWLSLT